MAVNMMFETGLRQRRAAVPKLSVLERINSRKMYDTEMKLLTLELAFAQMKMNQIKMVIFM